jgi:hypothetical protein
VPDIPRVGATVDHLNPDGQPCESAIFFDPAGVRDLFPDRDMWTVQSLDPLTLSPSLQYGSCSDHGFVRAVRRVRA